MRQYEKYPDFTIYSCVIAGHHLRVGAAPPKLRGLDVLSSLDRREVLDEAYCEKTGCGRLHEPGITLCAVHRARQLAYNAVTRLRQRAARVG